MFLFLLIFLFLVSCQTQENKPKVCFANDCVSVELAVSPEEKRVGLMERSTLEGGMLFVFEEDIITKFWMRNTLIPLDMIWIDTDNKIIFIQENAQPCKDKDCIIYGPDSPAKYVLEVNGGYSEENGISVGAEVEIFI